MYYLNPVSLFIFESLKIKVLFKSRSWYGYIFIYFMNMYYIGIIPLVHNIEHSQGYGFNSQEMHVIK